LTHIVTSYVVLMSFLGLKIGHPGYSIIHCLHANLRLLPRHRVTRLPNQKLPFTPSCAYFSSSPLVKMALNKKLIVACDGTWDDSGYGMKKEYSLEHPWGIEMAAPPSNVTRICRSILPHDETDRQQIVYYQAGIGSEQDMKDKLWGGLTGYGLAQHVREAYAFLCHNYEHGDEIILIGFSRGAFTARTIGAMVNNLGLLSMRGMKFFFPIFKDWENKETKGYVSPFQEPFPTDMKKPSLSMKLKNEPYQTFLAEVTWLSLALGSFADSTSSKDCSNSGKFQSNA
jgi:Uncharacterized alpha/beta hydrolase domain (DUF2235)